MPTLHVEISGDYSDLVLVDEYGGKISLCAAKYGRDGEIYKQWSFLPERKQAGEKSRPSDKMIPVKILIGQDREEALRTLAALVEIIKGVRVTQTAGPKPAAQRKIADEDTGEIPF